MLQNKLADEQKVAYQILKNGLKNNSFVHAYLFVGEKGTPKMETAIFLAQSLLCDQEGFACETCDTCQRVKDGNYADLIIKDGTDSSIKKEDILNIQVQFSKTAIEAKGRKIYILNMIENATPEALNSLLKFLEEPSEDVTAILICEQQDRLLPTIISRCQMIPFRKTLPNALLQKCRDENMNELDAYLLTYLVNNYEQISEIIEDENYQNARYLAISVLEKMILSVHEASLFLQIEGFKDKKGNDRAQFNYFIEILMRFFKDCLRKDCECQSEQWQELIRQYQKKNCVQMLSVCMQIKDKYNKSVNIKLLSDQLMAEIRRCSHE